MTSLFIKQLCFGKGSINNKEKDGGGKVSRNRVSSSGHLVNRRLKFNNASFKSRENQSITE